VGHCQEFTRRQIIGEPYSDERDTLAAWLGTTIGEGFERAVQAVWPGALTQVKVTATISGDQGIYEIPGHVDLILPVEGGVIDCKTSDGIELPKRTGPNQQQWFQRNLYALGAWQAGLFPAGTKLTDLWTANVWIDRSGRAKELVVHRHPYDPLAVKAAAGWVDDVVYAVRHGEEAQREQPREFCAKVCERFSACRGLDTDVEGLLTDPTVLAAVDMSREASALAKVVKTMKAEASSALEGVRGSTGEWTVRWVNVPPSHISYDRAGYQRLMIQPVKGRK
jgi:hypothetical protein